MEDLTQQLVAPATARDLEGTFKLNRKAKDDKICDLPI